MIYRRVLIGCCIAAAFVSAASTVAQQQAGGSAPAAPAASAAQWPTLPDLQSASPVELQKAAAALRSHIKCANCKGSGEITTREKTGERKGGHFKYPIYKDVTSKCERCDGAGYGDWEDIQRELERTTAAICDLDTSNPQASQKLAFAESVLRDLLTHNPGALKNELNRIPEAELRAGRGSPGDLVIVVVEDPIQNFPGVPTSARLVRLKGTFTPIVLDNPKIVGKGVGVALIGGRLAGYHKDSQGNVYPVLQNGFIVYAK